MLKVNLYDHLGQVLKEVTLPKSLFAAKVAPELVAQALFVYRANSHQGTSKAQTRGDVNRTTAKWYKQKGTGRARHGARSAPLFVGGGAAHGPKGLKAGNLKLPLKMKHLAILALLTDKATRKSVTLITHLDKLGDKTKDLSGLPKGLLLTAQDYVNLNRASGNLRDLRLVNYRQINALTLSQAKFLIIDEAALPLLEKWLVKNKLSTKN